MPPPPYFTILAVVAVLFALLVAFTVSMQLALWIFIGVGVGGVGLFVWRWRNL